MFKRILLPLDGSELAETVIPVANDLAKHYKAKLILFHVLEKEVPDTIHGERHLGQVEEARAYLNALADQVRVGGVEVEIDLHEPRQANVAQSISEHARELQADLVVLCAHGRGGLRDILIGGIAQQVIHQETIPVLFIRPDQVANLKPDGWKLILVPFDGKPNHETALPVAASLAETYDARLRLLTVVPTADTLPSDEAAVGRLLPASTVMALDLAAQEAKEYLQRVANNLAQKNLSVSGLVLRGDTVSGIIETVDTEKVDLIVMATHGHHNLSAFWAESTMPKILSKSPVPVLFVREIQEENESPG